MDSEVIERLDRIERLLSVLVEALANESDDDEPRGLDLEGNAIPSERNPNDPL
jgi:hypothetical protein